MNNEYPPNPDFGPRANYNEPRSKKGWLLGGCGCLSLLGLICIGGGVFFYFKWIKPTADFFAETNTLILVSPVVKEKLGEPVKVEFNQVSPTVSEDGELWTYRIPVSGSQASGIIVAEAKNSAQGIERGRMYLEVDGETIELDPEEAFPVPQITIEGEEDLEE